ncbi:MAG: hypothetical protein JSU58_10060 [Dehalococcoidales bacterium]|nr:MAG: hypothetical protein JSU58_10060 [Dehalococcoidales bacterium]
MKSKVKKLVKRQDGQIFLIALVLLAVGGLMLPPLLSFMGTGIKVSELHEEEALSLYAADAGIEDALHLLKYTNPENYPSGKITGNISDINGNYVKYNIDTTIIGEDTRRYRITSNATDFHNGSTTTVEVFVQVTEVYSAYGVLALDGDINFGGGVEIGDPSGLPTNIHANGNIDGGASITTIAGNATATGTIDHIDVTTGYTINENVDYQVTVDIDTSTNSTYYTGTWNVLPHYGNLTVDNFTDLGPAYIDGNLEIKNTGTVNLTGHVWVTGSVIIKGTIDSTANVSDNTSIDDMYALISENRLDISGTPIIGSDGHYILFISLYPGTTNDPAINVGGGGDIWAILFAPNGHIDSAGGAFIQGAAIGKSVRIQGNSPLNYPFPAQQDDNKRETDIISYIIK